MDGDMKKWLEKEIKELSPESIEKVKIYVRFLHYEEEKREPKSQTRKDDEHERTYESFEKGAAMLTDDFLVDGLPESKSSFREEM